uniref:Obscurin-like cytoskeletal adaptor 1 n=1 Tax=Xenopus tropicalis TaxID=8364 RepID=A0A6I8Q9N6_XENTR
MAALSLHPPNTHLALEMPGGAPRFLCFPRSITAPCGSQAVLRCRISGDPPPQVRWERAGNIRMELGDRCAVQNDGDWYQLVISDLRPEDTGHYMCRASNWSGEGYAGAKITVTPNLNPIAEPPANLPLQPHLPTELPPVTELPPHFLLTPVSQRLCRGQSGELTCKVSGVPEPTIRWEKDGRSLDELCDGSHYCLSPGGHTLSISRVHPPDAGVYVCRATNTAGQCLAAAVVLVDPTQRHGQEPYPGDPPAQVKVFTVNEGKHAKLRCLVTGKPRPEIIWRKDGRAVSPGRRTLIYEDREGHFILKVLFCRQQDRGLYVCGASNTAGNTLSAVMLHVREIGERFPAPLKDIAVREGQDAVLECSVPDGSRTSWYLEDQRLHPDKRHHMEEQGPIRRLIIRGARTDDDGVYMCQTQQGSQSIAEVAVRGPITKKLPRRLEVAEGGNAAFCAETESEMEQIGWTLNGHILSETQRMVVQSFGRTHVLVLVGVTQKDAGIVQFHAGLSESSCQLRVKAAHNSAPPYISELISRYHPTRLLRPLLTCSPTPLSFPPHTLAFKTLQGLPPFSGIRSHKLSDFLPISLFSLLTARGVSIKPATGEAANRTLGAGQPLCLSCHVPGSAVRVRWMKDGQELESGGHFTIQSEGRVRRLLISSSHPSDSGTYTCHTPYPTFVFLSLFSEPPVKIINTSDNTQHKCLAGEQVVLSCEVSRESAHVRWYRDGAELGEHEGLRLEADGRHRRLVIPSAKPQDSGEFVCDAGNDSVFYHVTVKEPPVKIVNTCDDTEHSCLSGGQVELSCEVSRESARVRWYKDGVEVEETEGIRLESDGRHRRLVICAAGTQDSGEFVCDTGDDSVFYNVTVTVSAPLGPLYPPAVSVLSCEVSRESARVRWYKDGTEVEETEGVRLESDGKHRRLVISNAHTRDCGEFVCDAGTDSIFYTVTVREPPVRILSDDPGEVRRLSGESVTLSCELSRESALVRWYKDGERLEESERVRMESEGALRRLLILSARVGDSGEFVCDAGDDSAFYSVTVTGNITVTDPPVIIVNTSEDSDLKCLTGEQVLLSCEVSRESAHVAWYRDGVEVEESDRVRLEEDGTIRRLTILCAETHDSGEYVCDARDDSVFYYLSPPVKFVNTSDDLELKCVTGEQVVLSCEVTRENARVRWYRDGMEVEEAEGIRAAGTRHTLRFLSVQPEDAGQYHCNVGGDSRVFTVNVDGECHVIANAPVSAPPGDPDLRLALSLSRADAEVRWYKDGERLRDAPHILVEERGAECSLTILGLERADAGEYLCDVSRDSFSFYVAVGAPRVVEFVTELQNITVLEGETASFKCMVSPDDVDLRWELNGSPVYSDKRFSTTSTGMCHSLTLRSCRLSDSGKVTANAEGLLSRAKLRVQEAQVLFTQGLQDMEAEEEQDLELRVQVTKDQAEIHWVKQGVVIQPSPKYTLQASGCTHSLTIHRLQASDRGRYCCESLHDRTECRLNVTPRSISIRKGLKDIKCEEGSGVDFTVELSHEGLVGEWWKGGVRVTNDNQCTIRASGRQHFLHLSDLTVPDSCVIAFIADSLRTTAQLTVTEPPLTITQPPQDFVVNEGGAATFQCEVSRQEATVTWDKDGVQLVPSARCRMYSVGRRRILQLSQCGPPDAGTYTCHMGDINAGATLRVLEQEPQMLKDLQDVDIVENENAVFTCEVSCAQAKGEWFKNGEPIRVTNTTKIRQEGRRHFLLICGAQCEDAGEITFRARRLQSTALRIVKSLRDRTALEGHRVVLECKVNPPRAQAKWLRGGREIFPSAKYQICNEDGFHKLIIADVAPEDEDMYTVSTAGGQSSARLLVEGKEGGGADINY